MIASTVLPSALQRVFSVVVDFLQKFLMVVGCVFIIGLIGVQSGRLDLGDRLAALLPNAEAEAAEAAVTDAPAEADVEAEAPLLSPRMRGALDYVSRRYRVSTEALRPIFATAQATGRELHLDPLLIIAVIGIESGFNPFSQSVVGAQGLMQVVPRFHHDKLPEENASFLDPVTNVQVGARVLKESIARSGGVIDGLQQFGGALNDPEKRYSSKVLGEHQRLQAVAQLGSKA